MHSFSVMSLIPPPCFRINYIELPENVKTSSSSSTSLDLGVSDGHEVVVADATTPKPISLVVKYTQKME